MSTFSRDSLSFSLAENITFPPDFTGTPWRTAPSPHYDNGNCSSGSHTSYVPEGHRGVWDISWGGFNKEGAF